ncbi:MAG: hypothetical protein KY456_12190 [Chloroflexi bacterium]|nr:hypothetical protein [Chloroflexota bacterium]
MKSAALHGAIRAGQCRIEPHRRQELPGQLLGLLAEQIMTMLYSHVLPPSRRESVARVDALLDGNNV